MRSFFSANQNSGCYNDKRESYMDATITLKFRLMKLIWLIGDNAQVFVTPVECSSDSNIHTPLHVSGEVLCFPNVYPCIYPNVYPCPSVRLI